MEKNNDKLPPKRIVLLGAESTGKSTLTKQLAQHYNTLFVEEFARTYVENINRPYTYNDIEIIAKKQIEMEADVISKVEMLYFLDTDLIITKIWFTEVYKKCPEWIAQKIIETHTDLYLLCQNDIEWKPDAVRENGGKQRDFLYKLYKKELTDNSFNFRIVSGKNNLRLENAIKHIEHTLASCK